MNRTEIIKQLKACATDKEGRQKDVAFISLNKIAEAVGIGKDRAKTILAGTDYLGMGNARKYLISDVAEALLEARRR